MARRPTGPSRPRSGAPASSASAAKKTGAKKASAQKAPAKKAPAKKAPAQKAPAKKAPAKKVSPTPGTAKKSAPSRTPGGRPATSGRDRTAKRPAGRGPRGTTGITVQGTEQPLWARPGAVFTVVGVILALLLAPSIRDAFEQGARKDELAKEKAEVRTDVAELRAQLKQWDDPEFIKAQARQRLRYAMPGEVSLVATGGEVDPVTGKNADDLLEPSWKDRLWQSWQAASGINGADLSDQELIDQQQSEP